jgi:hypothetical protein
MQRSRCFSAVAVISLWVDIIGRRFDSYSPRPATLVRLTLKLFEDASDRFY